MTCTRSNVDPPYLLPASFAIFRFAFNYHSSLIMMFRQTVTISKTNNKIYTYFGTDPWTNEDESGHKTQAPAHTVGTLSRDSTPTVHCLTVWIFSTHATPTSPSASSFPKVLIGFCLFWKTEFYKVAPNVCCFVVKRCYICRGWSGNLLGEQVTSSLFADVINGARFLDPHEKVRGDPLDLRTPL